MYKGERIAWQIKNDKLLKIYAFFFNLVDLLEDDKSQDLPS
jgi:hypothetical protein